MVAICNVKVEALHEIDGGPLTEWDRLYFSNEHRIESGSAFFAQAFADALGVVTDLELHDPAGAELKLQSITFLLERALEQYEAAQEFESWTGLSEFHERRLREAGLNFEGVCRVLGEAANRTLLGSGAPQIESLATTFEEMGYAGLSNRYLARVREIRDLTASITAGDAPRDGVAWQELGWKLIALFTTALEIGQAMAILNTFTFRLEETPSTAS